MTTAIRPNHQAHSPAGEVVTGLYQIGISAGAGALAGYAFSLIHPIGGAIFGATFAVVNSIGTSLANQFGMNEEATKTALYAVSYIISTLAGAFATTTLGFPLTFLSGVVMTFGMIITTQIVEIAAKCIANANGAR